MVAKNNNQSKKEDKKSRVKVGKLQLNKETVKDLTASERKQVKGGLIGMTPEKSAATGCCGQSPQSQATGCCAAR